MSPFRCSLFLSMPLCVPHSSCLCICWPHSLYVCLYHFPSEKVPMMHGASPAAVSAATTSATSVPFASASANQVCSFMAFSLYLSLSHTHTLHTHTLSLSLSLSFCLRDVSECWGSFFTVISLPLVVLHGFFKRLFYDISNNMTNVDFSSNYRMDYLI